MIEDEVRLALESLPPADRPPLSGSRAVCMTVPRVSRIRSDGSSGCWTKARRRASRSSCLRCARAAAGRRAAGGRHRRAVSEVVLALGFCGNALRMSAENLTLVFPRVDDCVSLLLNDGCAREEIQRNPRCYYLTRGWFSH